MIKFLILSLFLSFSFSKAGSHHHKMSFKNIDDWVKAFDDPSRDEWQKPDELIKSLNLTKNAVVGDLGAGTGYFSLRIAKMYPQSTVYAVDNEKEMVQYLQQRASKENLPNLKPILSQDDGFDLDKKLDILLIVNTYHHLPQREKYFQKIKQQLKPGGQVVVVDFLPESPLGPPQKFRFQPPFIQKELAASGYSIDKVLKWPRQFVLFLKTEPQKEP